MAQATTQKITCKIFISECSKCQPVYYFFTCKFGQSKRFETKEEMLDLIHGFLDYQIVGPMTIKNDTRQQPICRCGLRF